MSCTECEGAVFARGVCQKHYYRMRRHGSYERKHKSRVGRCAESGCKKGIHARGLCAEHYQKARGYLRSTWTSLRSRYPGEYPLEWDSYEAFVAYVDQMLGDRPSGQHQLRRPDPTRRWGAGNMTWREPLGFGTRSAEDRARYAWVWHLRNRYDLTEAELAVIIEIQGGACPICTRPLDVLNPKTGKPEKICVDHDHTIKDRRAAVRGVIHDACNKGMGALGDDAANCRRAAEYLDAHGGRRSIRKA